MINCEVKKKQGPEKYIRICINVSSDIYPRGSAMADNFQEKIGWNYYNMILGKLKEYGIPLTVIYK